MLLKKNLPIYVFLAILVVACKQTELVQSNTDPLSFNAFIQQVKSANFNDFAKRRGVEVQTKKDFQEIKNHILYMYEGVAVEHSFISPSTRVFDCIPILQQPGLKNSPKVLSSPPPTPPPPPPLKFDPAAATSTVATPTEDMSGKKDNIGLPKEVKVHYDKYGNPCQCEEGFIPMRRLNLERLIGYPTLHDFFMQGKTGPPPPAPAPPTDSIMGDEKSDK